MAGFSLEDYLRINTYTMDRHTDLIFVKDRQLRYVYVNDPYEALSLYSREEILGKTGFEIFPKAVAEDYHSTDLMVLQDERTISYEQTIDTTNSIEQDFLVTKSPIIDDKRNVIGIYGSARSISELVQTREELQTNLNLINTLLDTIPYPIFIKNLKGVYIKVNHAYSVDLEMPVEEIEGKDDIELYGEKLGQYYQLRDQKVMQTQGRDVYISTGLRQDVKYITTKDVLRNSEGEIIGVIGIVNTYQELSNIRDDIISMQRINSISQLVAGIAHDLNNILTNVVALSSLLLYVEKDETKRGDLESINSAALNASELINKLKTFAQVSELKKTPVEINKLVADTIRLLSAKYGRRYPIIEEYVDQPVIVEGDRVQLSQLVMNLAINAVEAMEEGSHLRISTAIETLDEQSSDYMVQPENFTGGKYFCLSVEDEGRGIDPVVMNQIFEPYFSSKSEGSSGLGLSIVYGVIVAHEALLRVNSVVGQGTRFVVYFPME